MNILYIGPYKQLDGWGRASLDYLKALTHTSHDITARHVWLNGGYGNNKSAFTDNLEDKVKSGYDVIIQNVLPPFADYQSNVLNIMQFYLETSPLVHTTWPTQMKLFDRLWVPTITESDMVYENGVKTPVNVVQMPFDIDELHQEGKKLRIPNVADDDFVFYFIGEYISRKNITSLIMAFHREFTPVDKVQLVIKTNRNQVPSSVLENQIQNDIKALYDNMRLRKNEFGYIREVIITDKLAHEDMLALHRRGDCLVMPSHAESTCRPVLEALTMGNQAIVTANTGMANAAGEFAFNVDSISVPVRSIDHPLPELYTSNEIWQDISITELQKTMRAVYEGAKKPSAIEYIKAHNSYQAVADWIEIVL